MSRLNHKTENASAGNTGNKRVRHRSRNSTRKRRRILVTRIFGWIKRNPLKTIGILCGVVIIYLTFLFIQWDKKKHTPKHDKYFRTID